MHWTYELRGGDFDGMRARDTEPPEQVVIAFWCGGLGCEGHVTDVEDPDIPLASALAYQLADCDDVDHHAVYEVGDVEPGALAEARELVGVGAGDGLILTEDDFRRRYLPPDGA